MNYEEVRTEVVDVIQSFQEISGEEMTEIKDDTSLFEEVPNFDSMRAAEVASELGEKFDFDVDDQRKLFTPESRDKSVRVRDVVERLCKTLGVEVATSKEEVEHA